MLEGSDLRLEGGQLNNSFSSNNNRMFNFSVNGSIGDDDDQSSRKAKSARDPLSHRIIEKRRRDRMNTCLADLSQLLPTSFLKQGQGRIEKTEIIEMAIKHIKLQQARLHAAVHYQNKVTFEEKLLQGYQDCCADTSHYMDQIGYKSSDTMYRNLCSLFDAYINKQKNKINQMYEVLEKQTSTEGSIDNSMVTDANDLARKCNNSGSGVGGGEELNSNSKHLNEMTTCESFIHYQNFMENNSNSETNNIVESKQSGSDKQSSDSLPLFQRDSAIGSSTDTYNCNVSNTMSSDYDSKVYKYKNKIQQRFSAVDVTKNVPSPDDKDDIKGPMPTSIADVSDTNSNRYSSTMGSNYESSVRSNSSNESARSTDALNSTLSNTVPAFALHPMGVHYIPLVLPVSQVMPFMRNHKSMGICHPVSIPVSFTGPFLMGEPEVDHDRIIESSSDISLKNTNYGNKRKDLSSKRSESDLSYYNSKNKQF